jgi:osmotically-inducible protein OsmY
MRHQPWIDATYISIVVSNGIVELSGMVESEDQRGALRVLTQGIPGVRKISDHTYIRPAALAGD